MLLLLLSRFSHVRLCATPKTAAHQAPPTLRFSRQEHWSGLPFPSPTHESEEWKWSHSVVSNSLRPHGLQPTRLLRPWDFPDKSTGVGCHCLLQNGTKLNLKHLYNEGNYKQSEKTPSEWKKIIANQATDKKLISKIYKQLMCHHSPRARHSGMWSQVGLRKHHYEQN